MITETYELSWWFKLGVILVLIVGIISLVSGLRSLYKDSFSVGRRVKKLKRRFKQPKNDTDD